MFDGSNYYHWIYNFRLLTTTAGLWQYLNGQVRPPVQSTLLRDFAHYSTAAFTVLNRNCAAPIQVALRRFLDSPEPGHAALQYLDCTYQAKDSTNRALLLTSVANLQMQAGENVNTYLNQALTLWEQLKEVGAPVPEATFLTFLPRLGPRPKDVKAAANPESGNSNMGTSK